MIGYLCYHYLFRTTENLTKNNCKKRFSKGADTPVLLQSIIPEIVAAKSPLFKEFYYTLKGLCRTEIFGSSEVSRLKAF